MLVGWGGNNGSTLTAAVLANRLRLSWPTRTGRKVGGLGGAPQEFVHEEEEGPPGAGLGRGGAWLLADSGEGFARGAGEGRLLWGLSGAEPKLPAGCGEGPSQREQLRLGFGALDWGHLKVGRSLRMPGGALANSWPTLRLPLTPPRLPPPRRPTITAR